MWDLDLSQPAAGSFMVRGGPTSVMKSLVPQKIQIHFTFTSLTH